MWSGRFREPLNREFERWQASFRFDVRLLVHEVAASKAHAKAIAAAQILSHDELGEMLRGLDEVAKLRKELPAALVASGVNAEDIHHFVELELTKRIGDLALKLHAGRSRNEQIATDMRLFVREAIDKIVTGLRDWARAG